MLPVADISRNVLEIMTDLYDVELIDHQMRTLDISPQRLAELARVSVPTVNAALAGQLGTLKTLRRITDALLIKWEYITRKNKRAFHRAVLTNGVRTRRSVKSGPVSGSANRPRSKELTT